MEDRTAPGGSCACPYAALVECHRAAARLRVAVLASSSGTTCAALVDAFAQPTTRAEIVLLIASRGDVPAIALAQRRGVAHAVTDAGAAGSEASDRLMIDALQRHEIRLVVLAGYLKRVGPETLSAFPGAIVNTHPAPLPRFGGMGIYGDRVHQAVLDSGVAMSAATVHLADAGYDTGPVIAQRAVPVHPGDDVSSLRARVQIAEREQPSQTIAAWPERRGLPR